MSYPMLYNLQIKVYQIIEYLQYRRCPDCAEIVFDGYCDFCNRLKSSYISRKEPEKTTEYRECISPRPR